jgi:hypothetical protein
MGQKRKDGRPIYRHARTKVWFREKKGTNAQTQTWGSSGSDCSSSKWHDPPTPRDAECHRFDAAVERSGYEDIPGPRIPNPKCETRGSGSRPASTHQERTIHLHLNLKSRESPQLVVCPRRNHCQLQQSHETLIPVDDDAELLLWPSRPAPPEPALSLQEPSQLQSLRQAHQGSGSRSSSDKVVPSHKAQLHNVERSLPHERAMSRNELDIHHNPAYGHHHDEQRDLNSQSGDSEVHVNGYVNETLLPKWPPGQQVHVITKSPPELACLVKIATSRSCSNVKMKNEVPLRVKGGSGSPHSEPVQIQDQAYVDNVSTPPQTEGVVLSWEGLTVTSK